VSSRRRVSLAWIVLAALAAAAGRLPAQQQDPLPQALDQMIAAERAFAAKALEVGWKQAFLEFFALDAVGFDEGRAGLARQQIAANPDPPKDQQLLWEPRYGDIAASGELGYLTGPVQNIRPSRDGGRPRHSNYASIWKRQRDGSFKVIVDVGIPTPSAPPFAAGFTRAPYASRFTGDYDDTTPPLATADGLLNAGVRANQVRGYRQHLAPFARLHRPNLLPLVGDRQVLQWLASQPAFSTADSRYSEAARSGDLGYTWGTYSTAARGAKPRLGFYVRVWVRERNGQWKLALDVLQPQ
jgi:ketosteroid isomerase-like protein